MRKEYIDKLLVLSPCEKELYEKKEIGNSNVPLIEKDLYFFVHENIKFIRHNRFATNVLHGHEFVEMMYVINGEITHEIEGKEVKMKAGDIIIMNKYVKHKVNVAYEKDLAVNFIFLPEFFDEVVKFTSNCKNKLILDFLINILKDDKRPQYMLFETQNNVAVENLLEILMLPFFVQDTVIDETQMLMALMFKYLVDDYNLMSDKYSNEIMGELIISYINNNYKSASLEDLAWQLNKPISTLSRNIRTMTGCKFNELVKRKRFQQAAILLVETDMSIMEIMNSVGYENSSYFYNEFRQRYDLSPKDYRKKNKDSDKIQI